MTEPELGDAPAVQINAFGRPDDEGPGAGSAGCEVALAVDLGDRELDRKRRAPAAHASRTTSLAEAEGEAAYRTWWVTETFRRATARSA